MRPQSLRAQAGALVATMVLLGTVTAQEPSRATDPALLDTGAARQSRPNIVLVLMDDFSMDLLSTMRGAASMRRRGASYPHSFVVDSLCCVSRASLFTGQYPHQTGVRLNTPSSRDPSRPRGGYQAYRAYGNDKRTFVRRLQRAGYTTGLIGKFLNRYEYSPGGGLPARPPGWSEFNVLFAQAYDGWGFFGTRVDDGGLRLRRYPAPPVTASQRHKDRRYAGTVTQRLALSFIRRHRDDRRPWFLEVAPYAPHSRTGSDRAYPDDPVFPPAFRDRPSPERSSGNCGRLDCLTLGVDDLPGFRDDLADNRPVYGDGTPAPRAWAPVDFARRTAIRNLRDRARMVQSIDRMLRRILRQVPARTYVVLTSDNGLHLGQHGLGRGKGSAYDTDVRVPLLVVGPGVRPGARPEVVSNIDLAPTFEDLAGLASPRYRSGRSLVPTFADVGRSRNNYAFVEHTWSGVGDDPDSDPSLRRIPSYIAVRSRGAVLIRSDLDRDLGQAEFVWEFYEYIDAPYERTNTYADPRDPTLLARMKRKLRDFTRCSNLVHNDAVPAECRRDLRR